MLGKVRQAGAPLWQAQCVFGHDPCCGPARATQGLSVPGTSFAEPRRQLSDRPADAVSSPA
jgi:hypothetical protein